MTGPGLRLLLGGVLLTISAAPPATAAVCADAIAIARQLESKYGEAPAAVGLQTNGTLLMIYASDETGTWTAVTISPHGLSCIVATGRSWEQLPFPTRDDPES